MPVKIEDVVHRSGNDCVTSHWVRPSSWVRELMRLYPGSLTGGLTDINDIDLQFRTFWRLYQQFHGDHQIFSSPLQHHLGRVIPTALFGDEGRGPKRGQFLVWSMESVLGLDDMSQKFQCKCCESLSSFPAVDVLARDNPRNLNGRVSPEEFERAKRQSTNNKNHSFLTRHVLFGLPHWMYKGNAGIEQKHIELMVEDMNMLFSTGVEVNGIRWYACTIGCKGDFKHHASTGCLNRSYHTIGRTYGNLMCSFCMAGAPGYPYEAIEHEPLWSRTLFSSRPWDTRPGLMMLCYDESKPEHALKLDAFHLWKVGLGRDLVGSAIIIMCRIGCFDGPNDPKDLDSRLSRSHGSFRLWCLASHKSPGLQSFSKSFFSMKSYADSPWSNSKGSDTMLLSRWLHWLVCLQLNNLGENLKQHEWMLRLLQKTLEESFQVMQIGSTHGMWLTRACAKHLYGRMFVLLRCYRSLAAEALAKNFNAWGLKPKMHALHHLAYDLRIQLKKNNLFIINPWVWNNEQNEDTIGRVSRLARKVSVRTITTRVLSRYFLKKRALMKRKFTKQAKR